MLKSDPQLKRQRKRWTGDVRQCLSLRRIAGCFLIMVVLSCLPSSAGAHGITGKRFFPTTLAIEDPFVSDELSFVVSHIKELGEGEEGPARSTEVSFEYSKRITPNLGISVGNAYLMHNPDHGDAESGFGNLELGIKYQFFKSDAHEAVVSAGFGAEIGGTGAKRIVAESYSVLSPAVFFGKGFGDLPEGAKFFRPFAITGMAGLNVPTRSKNVFHVFNEETGESEREIERNPTTLSWGLSLQYSLHYLQTAVQDIGLGAPLNRMVLLVEFPFETCLTNDCKGKTTGYVNPGIVWFGKTLQLGLEAQIPINNRTGRHVGVLGILHFFLDDLFPKSIGRPIFGNAQ